MESGKLGIKNIMLAWTALIIISMALGFMIRPEIPEIPAATP